MTTTDLPAIEASFARLAGALAELGVTRIVSPDGEWTARRTDLPALLLSASESCRHDDLEREFRAPGIGITIMVGADRARWRADDPAVADRFARAVG